MNDRPTNPETGRVKLHDDEELPPEAPSGWVNQDYDEATEQAPKTWISRLLIAGIMLFMFYIFAGQNLLGLFR